VPLPISRPTSVAFGGPDLRTLYVTSMTFMLDEAALAREPYAGRLLAFEPGVQGIALPKLSF
jgi:sugar lactone lactonase YvrE